MNQGARQYKGFERRSKLKQAVLAPLTAELSVEFDLLPYPESK